MQAFWVHEKMKMKKGIEKKKKRMMMRKKMKMMMMKKNDEKKKKKVQVKLMKMKESVCSQMDEIQEDKIAK